MSATIFKEDNEIKIREDINESVKERTKAFFKCLKESSDFSYRVQQYAMSLEVVDILRFNNLPDFDIREASVLLEEAGVGVGKSYAYLVPLLFYIDEYNKRNIAFKPFIISTSSKALQKQLSDKDINKLLQLLDIKNINIQVAMGINNYVCYKNVLDLLKKGLNNPKQMETLERMRDTEDFSKSIDKNKYNLSKTKWKIISADHPEKCLSCKYCAKCLLPSQLKNYQNADILIMNHGYLASLAKHKNKLITDASAIVIDEAHNLEDLIRSTSEDTFRMEIFYDIIKRLTNNIIKPTYNVNDDIFEGYQSNIIKLFEKFYSDLRLSASNYFKLHNNSGLSFTECEEVSLDQSLFLNKKGKLYESTENLYRVLGGLLQVINLKKDKYNYGFMDRDINDLSNFYSCISDMINNQNFIYWVKLYKDNKQTKVDLIRTPKKINDVIDNITKDKPVILTSATMRSNTPTSPNNSGYNAIKNRLDLSNRTGIIEATPKLSPFNYRNNTLLYYDTTLPSPTDKDVSHRDYLHNLTMKIDELINISNGRSLVLFTNKKDMMMVYNYLSGINNYPFDIYYHDDNNSIINKFKQNTNSVLLSASLWEGIDIPGESLSQVIITRLPFPVSDAVSDYYASGLKSNEAYNQVIYPAMISKFKQGIGRLIRSETDYGVYSILDSRINRDLDTIVANLPGKSPITSDIRQVNEFFNQKNNVKSLK